MGHLSPGHRPFIGIVCGFRSEIHRIERALGPFRDRARLVASGASAVRAAEQAHQLIDVGAVALVSFGVAGALDPGLQVGDVVRATRVACAEETFGDGDVTVWGADQIVGDRAAKAAYWTRTGAAIVDMESHGVAKAATRAGLPFLVIRAVSDDARSTLPEYLLQSVGPDGRARLAPVLRGLARRPFSLPALLRLGRDTGRALDAAEQAARADLPDLFRRLDAL